MKKTGTLFFAGDTCLGRFQNSVTASIGYNKVLGTLDIIKSSDLALVNLECVVSSHGEHVDKRGEIAPYYFRARPEMLNILTEANIDMVSVANNHSGDYGPKAFSEMLDLLDQAGIQAIGGGKNLTSAKKIHVRRVGDVVASFIAIDFTTYFYAAEENSPGAFYLDSDKTEKWKDELGILIKEAQRQSDVVILVVHWGLNFLEEPSEKVKKLAKTLISLGADAILGSSAHVVHGVEIIDDKPVIYDAGNFLFDFETEDDVTGVFQLVLSGDGVEGIRFIPTNARYCRAKYAAKEPGMKTLEVFKERCKKMGTEVDLDKGPAVIRLKPKVKEKKVFDVYARNRNFKTTPPLMETPKHCTVSIVPPEHLIEERSFGPLELIGLNIKHKHLPKRNLNLIETYWKLAEDEVDKDFMILQRFVLDGDEENSMWQLDHDPCDWIWPTSRWKKGNIYYDRFLAKPPLKKYFKPGKFKLIMGISDVAAKEKYIERFDDYFVVDAE